MAITQATMIVPVNGFRRLSQMDEQRVTYKGCTLDDLDIILRHDRRIAG